MDIYLGYYNNDTLYPLRGLRVLIKFLSIRQKFLTYNAFGKATLDDVYGSENLKSAVHYKATNFATCYIENKGDGTFSALPLHNWHSFHR